VLPQANRALSIPDFELDERLTPEQVDFLETFGFIRFKRFVPRERARALYQAVLEINDALVARGTEQMNGVPLILGERADGTRYVQRIPFASLQHPVLRDFLQDRRFRGILEAAGPGYRIGEDERDGMVVNRFRNEPGAKYKRLGWHTDSLRDLFYLEKPRRYLNVGFNFTDSPLAVGGLRVLPCTHHQPISALLTRKLYFVDDQPDPYELAVEAEAGDLTIHDGRMWHRTALAATEGDASERCVSYLPLMEGPLKRKHAKSATPLYLRFKGLVGY
jgi:Phytanoyl-CoA dioxygenase (PhyH)